MLVHTATDVDALMAQGKVRVHELAEFGVAAKDILVLLERLGRS
ncbi:hypothetical protein [Mycobacterium sp. 155]